MSKNTQNIQDGDLIKVISTERVLSQIGACGDNLKGKVGTVTHTFSYGVGVKFENIGCWILRFSDIHKVLE